jgi:hypothetical protein
MNVRSLIAAKDIEDFLVAIHFSKQDLLGSCVRLAYRDVQRTIRGVAKFTKVGVPERVRDLVLDARRAQDQGAFDTWHQTACADLIAAFRAIGYDRATIGHAQKWLNMSLKYVFILGERVPGYAHVYPFCHVPLDRYVIEAARPLGFPGLPGTGAWSSLNDYAIYMNRQQWFRDHFDEPPIIAEFRLWLGSIASLPTEEADRASM